MVFGRDRFMAVKVVFENPRGLKLVGILDKTETDMAIILVHGFTGDKDEWGRFTKAAYEFKKAGYAVLRFDFAGSGESDDSGITVENEVADLKSAIDFVQRQGYSKISLFGHSLGGLCSILVSDEKIITMVLTAPVTKAKTPDLFNEDQPMRKEIEEKGFVILRKHKEFRVEKQYIVERENINQEEILSKIKCPVLIIHGDKDEKVPLEHSQNAIQLLPEGSKLEIIRNADHGLKKEWGTIVSLATKWFADHFK